MAPRTKACTECQRVRKKCVIIEPGRRHCERCFLLGLSELCRFEVKAKAVDESVLALHPCARCSRNRWKCSVLPGNSVCRLCQIGGFESECCLKPPPSLYRYTSSESPASTVSDSGASVTSTLNHIMNAFDKPLQDQADMMDWAMEDPDLMPTTDDFMLAWSFCTANGTQLPMWFGMDGDYFLRTFFSQPAYLRLAVCALAAHTRDPPLPEAISFSLFQRARKAMFRMAGTDSCLAMAKAYAYLYLFSMHKGQPSVGKKFLERGLEIVLELQLDVDPDDMPWLNLSAREREDRRRAFWALYGHYVTDLAQNPEASFDIPVSGKGVKAPKAVLGPEGQLVFENCPAVKWVCELGEIMYRNRKFLANPPQSLLYILETDIPTQNLISALNTTLINCADLLLYSDSPAFITQSDATRFKHQLSSISARYVFQTYALNFSAFSAISVLHRPKLYITSLKSCAPRYVSHNQQQTILSAVNQCLESAHRITHLFFYSQAEIMAYFGFTMFSQQKYYIFEAAIVCWFVSCRMSDVWRGMVDPVLIDRMLLLDMATRMTEFMLRVVELEGTKSGSTSATLKCMQEMTREMRIACMLGGSTSEGRGNGDDVEALELGMTVMSLVGDDVETVEKEPYACLGLLGAEVGRGIRWKGTCESSWRLFWKLYD
ncbi:hypothetical protein BCR33DRAFT_740480 [Rhizoclosmatium globosum]|uniref:Zn(2)-C6 fungal-type domain-containing protein n=1 Tax=Rhizoclosmatium globosum TaxID=329046 RepID=A0A1Y2BZN5_9FUNG|nr:hypothetical protein BCR33DRAFT_740480 [Rhizoclosmatium globosum]|eukprot:ORY40221.1 hypothetical protein BCR33DRAFT_740480 [Rhizoclosmatium globosum]